MHGIHDRSVAYSLAVAAGRLHLAGFAMALHWIIDTKRRLIVATAEEEITAGEVRDYLAMVTGAGVSNYRQLFDFSRASANFSARETLELGVLIQAHQKRPSSSALAVVTPAPIEASASLSEDTAFICSGVGGCRGEKRLLEASDRAADGGADPSSWSPSSIRSPTPSCAWAPLSERSTSLSGRESSVGSGGGSTIGAGSAS